MVSSEFTVLLTMFVAAFVYLFARMCQMSEITKQIQEDVDDNAAAVTEAFDAVESEIKTLGDAIADLRLQILNNDSKAAIQASLAKLEASTSKVRQIATDAKTAIAGTEPAPQPVDPEVPSDTNS